jgi:hypothetical protein
MTDTAEHTEMTAEPSVDDTSAPVPKLAWRTLVGAAIGGGAIVIAALLGIGAIKSDGGSNVRAVGGPGGAPPGQFQGPQFGPPGQMQGPGGMQGQMPPPPMGPRQQPGRTIR